MEIEQKLKTYLKMHWIGSLLHIIYAREPKDLIQWLVYENRSNKMDYFWFWIEERTSRICERD